MALLDIITANPDNNQELVEYRQVIEDHLDYLRDMSRGRIITVTPAIAYKYIGDFHGLLREQNCPDYSLYANTRANGLSVPIDYDGSITAIYVIDNAVLNTLFNKQRTVQRKSLF